MSLAGSSSSIKGTSVEEIPKLPKRIFTKNNNKETKKKKKEGNS